MRYTSQQQDRRNADYDKYRNYDDIEDADYERYGHGRSGGRGGMGRSYDLSGPGDSEEGYSDFGDDEVGYSEGRRSGMGGRGLAANYSDDRRGSMQRPSYREDRDLEMRSTGDRRASHDREFERDYDRKFARDSGYPLRRPEHDYDHSQERYSASYSRPHPSRLQRRSR